ncbi:leucine-rich repeat-containing protein 74A-like [Patiria miniata]|uniref:Uncharacterized protein n=1 Tax=Patiria miniata TaxID=46514 RepID=A0A914AYA6_PATMI|nr:leucine-rich repeat-containing protein 74A-like [Patiria miniata]
MASAAAKIHRCGGGYSMQSKQTREHTTRHQTPGSTRYQSTDPTKPPKTTSNPAPSCPAQHEPADSPDDELPTILITAEDLGLDFPMDLSSSRRSESNSPSPAKSPRHAMEKTPRAARPKTTSSFSRSRQQQASGGRQNARPTSSRSPGSSSRAGRSQRRRSRSGGQGRVGSRERKAKPTTAWSVTELPDDDISVATGGYDETPEPSELDLSVSSMQTSTDEQPLVEEFDEYFPSEGGDSLRSDDPIRRLIEGPPVDDAEYDTDLEEEFAPDKEMIYDSAGKNVYLAECKQEGVDPACYVVRHLHETTFIMRHRYIGMQALIPLAKAFRSNTCTETLDLSDNHLEGDGGAVIAYMMRDNCYITKLDVSENQMRYKGASGFASMLETNYTLKILSLSSNHLTDRDALRLSEGLKNNSTLTQIDLSHNDMGELAGVHLASALASNDGLIYLDLKWNGIRGKGVIAIANALKVNTALEVLDLSQNGVTLPGCTAFLQALKANTGLRVLDLSSNHINTPGAKKLALGLKKNTSLEALLLRANPMGDEGVLAVIKACPYSTNLKLLSLQEITLSLVVHQKMREVQDSCNLHILSRDYSGHRRTVAVSHLVAMVDQFIIGQQARILYSCFVVDEQRTCMVTAQELRKVLLDTGLDLSNEQIDSALSQVGVLHSDKIPYRPLLDGLSALQQRSRPAVNNTS